MNYYSKYLSADRLEKCYQLAPRRIRQYLKAEVDFVRSLIFSSHHVLELGCGYGRMFPDLLPSKGSLTGIDISLTNLIFGSEKLKTLSNIHLAMMNASKLGFKSGTFDNTLCLQNGLSAFHENPLTIITEAIRVTKPGGLVLFSGYSDKIWKDRLEWFVIQSEHGLLGEIDFEATGNGEIVCKDGFSATTFRKDDFNSFASQLGIKPKIFEVDDSCLIFQIDIPK